MDERNRCQFYVYDFSHFQRRLILNIVLVKESRNRPGVAQRFSGVLGSQVFMTFGT